MTRTATRRRLRTALPAALLLALVGWLVPATGARAQTGGGQPTAIGVAGPASVALGQTVTVQAKLVGVGGVAIPKARIDFTTTATFLHTTGEAVVATATTDATGVAAAQFAVRQSGALTIAAAFAGDITYAAAKASTPLTVTGSHQLYRQEAGVAVPGLNAPPGQSSTSSAWPRWALSGWPIAAVLLIVWSLYGAAALLVGQIAALGDEAQAAAPQSHAEVGR